MREQREVASRIRCEIVKVYRDQGVSGAKGRDKPPALDVEAQGYSPFAPYVDMSPTCRVEAYESCSDEVVSVTRSPSRLTCDVGLVTSMRPMSLVQSFAGRLCCSIGRHRSAHEHLGELCGRGACPRFWPFPTPLGFLLPVHTEGCRPFEVLNLGKRRFSSCPDKQANNP